VTDKQALGFNRCRMIKAENRELYDNTARTLREAAMLLLLRRTLTDVVTFCALENIRVTDNPPESPGTETGVRKLACKLKKGGEGSITV